MPRPTPEDASTFDNLLAWMGKNRPGWNPACESDLRNQLILEDGGFRPRNNPAIMMTLMKIAQTTEPGYQEVQCRSLGIFADNQVAQLGALLPEDKLNERAALREFTSFVVGARAEFDAAVPNAKSILLSNTDHFCFVHREADVAELILTFVEGR